MLAAGPAPRRLVPCVLRRAPAPPMPPLRAVLAPTEPYARAPRPGGPASCGRVDHQRFLVRTPRPSQPDADLGPPPVPPVRPTSNVPARARAGVSQPSPEAREPPSPPPPPGLPLALL